MSHIASIRPLHPAILARVAPFDPEFALEPNYDYSADLLEVGSPVLRDYPFGVDIDGTIIFDLSGEFKLGNFDLLIPKSLWHQSRELHFPEAATCGNLIFLKPTIEHKSFNMPRLQVATYPEVGIVQIEFDAPARPPSYVALSEDCIAALDGDRLVGFIIRV